MSVKILILNVLFILGLYVFLFNPPVSFLPFSPIIFLYLLCVILLLTDKKFYSYLKNIKNLFIILGLLLSYTLIRSGIAGNQVFINRNSILFFDTILLPVFIIYINNVYIKTDLIKSLIYTSLIAVGISLLMMLSPNFSEYIRFILLKTTEYTQNLWYRNFGFAESLTFSYGLILGSLAGIQLFYADKNKIITFGKIMLFLIVVLINARTGIIIFFTFFIFFLFSNISIKKISYSIFVIFIAFSLLNFGLQKLNINDFTTQWIMQFFYEISDFFTGSQRANNNTIDTLWGDMLIIPDSPIEWIFGRGIDIYLNAEQTSDVGYIIQLNYGGIVYIALLLSIILYLLLYSLKYKGKAKSISLAFIFALLICNNKGYIFASVGFFRLAILIIFYYSFTPKHIKTIPSKLI